MKSSGDPRMMSANDLKSRLCVSSVILSISSLSENQPIGPFSPKRSSRALPDRRVFCLASANPAFLRAFSSSGKACHRTLALRLRSSLRTSRSRSPPLARSPGYFAAIVSLVFRRARHLVSGSPRPFLSARTVPSSAYLRLNGHLFTLQESNPGQSSLGLGVGEIGSRSLCSSVFVPQIGQIVGPVKPSPP